uniref:Uncharacterized protein n=1 Tax=Amphimedon queenslandica TaxID=400682 RepID=A0A1X7TR66_AMPQE
MAAIDLLREKIDVSPDTSNSKKKHKHKKHKKHKHNKHHRRSSKEEADHHKTHLTKRDKNESSHNGHSSPLNDSAHFSSKRKDSSSSNERSSRRRSPWRPSRSPERRKRSRLPQQRSRSPRNIEVRHQEDRKYLVDHLRQENVLHPHLGYYQRGGHGRHGNKHHGNGHHGNTLLPPIKGEGILVLLKEEGLVPAQGGERGGVRRGHRPLVEGADQDQGREEMIPSPPPLLKDQSVLRGEGLVPLGAGLAHGRYDDLLIAPGGLCPVGGPVLPWDGRQGDGIGFTPKQNGCYDFCSLAIPGKRAPMLTRLLRGPYLDQRTPMVPPEWL